jgi:hypothetical protein
MARADDAAVAAGDGRIYGIGGWVADGTSSGSVEAYTPALDRWIDVAPLDAPRAAFCATIGPDGRIFVAGGVGLTSDETSVEVYGPVITLSPPLAPTGSMVTVFGSNFAVSAPVAITFDGAVVVTGTTDSAGTMAVSFRVPAAASGVHQIVTVDDKSRFPTRASLQLP